MPDARRVVAFADALAESVGEQGLEVVRWTWAHLSDFTDSAARIHDRFRQ